MNGAMGELSLCKGRKLLLGALQGSARRRWTKTVRNVPPQQSCKDLETTGSPKNHVATVTVRGWGVMRIWSVSLRRPSTESAWYLDEISTTLCHHHPE